MENNKKNAIKIWVQEKPKKTMLEKQRDHEKMRIFLL